MPSQSSRGDDHRLVAPWGTPWLRTRRDQQRRSARTPLRAQRTLQDQRALGVENKFAWAWWSRREAPSGIRRRVLIVLDEARDIRLDGPQCKNGNSPREHDRERRNKERAERRLGGRGRHGQRCRGHLICLESRSSENGLRVRRSAANVRKSNQEGILSP